MGGPVGNNCVGAEGEWTQSEGKNGGTVFSREIKVTNVDSGVSQEVKETKSFNAAGGYEGGTKSITTRSETERGLKTETTNIHYGSKGTADRVTGTSEEPKAQDKDKKQDQSKPKEETAEQKAKREKEEKAAADKAKKGATSMCADPSSCSDSCTAINQQAMEFDSNCGVGQLGVGAEDIGGAQARPAPGQPSAPGQQGGRVDPSREDVGRMQEQSSQCLGNSNSDAEACGNVMCGKASTGAIAGMAFAGGSVRGAGPATCCGSSIRGMLRGFRENACVRMQCAEGEQCQCTAQANKGGGRTPPGGDTVQIAGGVSRAAGDAAPAREAVGRAGVTR